MECGSVEKQFTCITRFCFIISLFVLVVSSKAGVAETKTSKIVPRQVNAKATPAQKLLKQAEKILISKANSHDEEHACARKARALLHPLLTSNQPHAILAEAYYLLGQAAQLDGDLEASRGYFLHAAALFPDGARQAFARTEAVSALRNRGDYATAIAECKAILNEGKAWRETQGNLYFMIGDCLVRERRINEAVWQWNTMIDMYPDISWTETSKPLIRQYQDAVLKQGKNTGPFTYEAGLAPPLAKAWASLDRKNWRTEELHIVVGQQVWFKASVPQATNPDDEAATLRNNDEDSVDGESVSQWKKSIKCLWDFTPGTQFTIVNVDECAAKTYKIPGRYIVKLYTDDIFLGTAFDDLPVPAVNELTIVVSPS
jgi:tetratricopeptide (TPR) repeat protein